MCSDILWEYEAIHSVSPVKFLRDKEPLRNEAAHDTLFQKELMPTTILLVEDDPILRPLLIELLEDLHYTVIAVSDGEEGIKVLDRLKAKNQPIDLLLTDIGLPGVNGQVLAERAKTHWPQLPILFITGFAHGLGDHLTLGQDVQILRKPFKLHALAEKVEELICRWWK